MTDYKDQALRCLDMARATRADGFTTRADFHVAEGQVHATLYLAEQQRLANLLAYAEVLRHPVKLESWTRHDILGQIENDLREGLGIESTS